ncbi:MAG: choice-of-anchor Q domain-containing protein, partial [Gammaproteobacteria bacterium]
LPTGSTQLLTAVDNTTLGPTGLPVIRSTITLRGRNSTIQRESDAPRFRILAVASSGDLTLHSTTVSGGRSGYYYGGGVYNTGTLTLTNSTVSGNDGGGGVFNSGTLTLTHSTVSGNSGYGGGVFNSGTLTLANSTVSGNRSEFDSGIHNSGTLTLINSTVSGNRSYACGHCDGTGGIDNRGTLTLTNSTVSGNSGTYGGGVYNDGGTLTLARTLISGNRECYFGCSPSEVENFGGTIVANNHNLFGQGGDAGVVGFSPGPTDIVPNAPLGAIRKPLADNGGPTRTHALPAGSPAIGQSPANSGCRPTDQRGVTRPQGAACDIGAFEKGPPVRCGGRIARIIGTVGKDRLTGTPGRDVIHGLAGRDTIDGLEGNDIICGGTGNDILFGGNGADALNGGSGTDICRGGSGADTGVSCDTEISIP